MKSILLIKGFKGSERFVNYYLSRYKLIGTLFRVKGDYDIIVEVEYKDYNVLKRAVSDICELHDITKIKILNVKG